MKAYPLLLAALILNYASASETITLQASDGDMTPVIREALEGAKSRDLKLVFEPGTYTFLPDYATERFCSIANHGNGLKKIAFLFEDFDSIEIEGNDADLIFHGQIIPFIFQDCRRVTVRNLSVDWEIPFTFLAEVTAINAQEGWRDVRPFKQGFSWELKRGRIQFPNIDGFNYTHLGSTLAFDPVTKRVTHGAKDMESHPSSVEKRKNGILRIHERLKYYPPIGSLLSSKGNRELDRYGPAFYAKRSQNIKYDSVTVHHALGMGYIFERSENIVLKNSGVHLRDNSPRVISSTADATHFAGCRGDILIENCRFENMLDDGTNVHGTYVIVDEIIDTHTLRVQLGHFEQLGSEFASAGDEVWFIQQPNPQRASENTVTAITTLNSRFSLLTFRDEIPQDLSKGNILENKTWNPTFTMRGCSIRNHRARNIVLKTPLKVVIEDNDFSSMMSSIFFRGESFFWYESGAVGDVLIHNNRFEYCAYSAMEHAVLNITPRLGKTFDTAIAYDRNIRFEYNEISTFDNRVVWADRVEGLQIIGNKIKQTNDTPQLHPDAPVFDFRNCQNVTLSGNEYEGTATVRLKADQKTQESLHLENNRGL